MKIHVKWLGVSPKLIDQVGHEFDIADGARISDFMHMLVSKNPSLSEDYLAGATFMVNKVRADQNQKLEDGDVVMILKNLGGGE